MLSIPAIRQ
jgi:hypothetical protein